MSSRKFRNLRRIACASLLTLTAAACGSDDSGSGGEASTTPAATDAPTTSVAAASTSAAAPNSSTTAGSSAPATTGAPADALAPQPLPAPVTLKVGIPTKAEFLTTILLGDATGEFQKEGITIEYVVAPATDTLPLLAAGDVDVLATSPTGGLINAISAGGNLKVVAPLNWKVGGKDGLWVRTELFNQGPAALKGKKIGAPAGPGASFVLPIADYLAQGGVEPTDVSFEVFPITDVPAAFENGAVDAAFLVSPTWQGVDAKGFATYIGGNPPGYGGVAIFGPSILEDNHDAGVAFVRAMARTNRDHLQAGYKDDPEVLAALAEAMGLPAETVASLPSYEFSAELEWDLPAYTRLQETWLKFGTDIVQIDAPLPDEELFDTSFIDEAVAG